MADATASVCFVKPPTLIAASDNASPTVEHVESKKQWNLKFFHSRKCCCILFQKITRKRVTDIFFVKIGCTDRKHCCLLHKTAFCQFRSFFVQRMDFDHLIDHTSEGPSPSFCPAPMPSLLSMAHCQALIPALHKSMS